jgi:hypothetical protein
MKFLLIAAALVAGPALACPLDGSKDADAGSVRSTDKAVVASTTKPATQRVAKQKTASAKVAVKPAAETSKAASL